MAVPVTSTQPWLFVIIGTTGSGKTKLSVELAEILQKKMGFKSEIVSADSMQLYKQIDVLSAKASVEEQARVKHHLLSILELDHKDFTVVSYQSIANPLISQLLESNICPILVGGTNYYIESVLWKDKYHFEYDTSSIPSTTWEELNNLSDIQLHARLASVDPIRAELLHPNARRKVLRSLEIYYATKRPHSSWIMEQQQKTELAFPKICIFWVSCDKDVLDKRLDTRVDEMISNGLKSELLNIADQFKDGKHEIDWSRGAFQSIGLREFQPWVEHYHRTGIDDAQLFTSAIDDVKTHSRQYARSQISWIKNSILPIMTVYKLDSTNVSHWQQDVLQPAETIASVILNNEPQDEIKQLFTSGQCRGQFLTPNASVTLTQWKKYDCEFCAKILNGDNEWIAHQKSKAHKAARRRHFKPNPHSSSSKASVPAKSSATS